MTGPQLLFWLFGATACAGAVAVAVSQNVVRMAVWLIVSLGAAAGLFFLANADFVGATQLLVYVGGTIVLLIFGVMLTASGPYVRIRTSPGEGVMAGAIGLMFLFLLFMTVLSVDWNRVRLHQAGIAVRTPAQMDLLTRQLESQRKEHDDASKGEGLSKAKQSESEAKRDAVQTDLSLIESTYTRDERSEPAAYRLKPGPISVASASRLATLWGSTEKISAGALPASGNTLRPLGLSFIGARPDRDLKKSGGSGLSPGYLLPFEIVSVHLLVVLVGAAYLARAKRRAKTSE